jgi:DNA-binding NarL/FixJ family response regulator
MSPIRLLVADDTTLVRRLITHQLASENDIEVVGEAADGREAVEIAARLRPDVLVMDLDMPHLNGAQATERITSQYPYVKVILLTALDGLASIGRTSGASECLNKGCTPQDLLAAIRRVHASRHQEAAKPASSGDYRIAIERLAVRASLSDREKTVVERVVGTDFTIHQIAHSLSTETNKTVSDSSVKHALERAITKMHIEPRTRATLIKHVLEFGENTTVFQGDGYR